MEEDFTKNCNKSIVADEKEKVKDFVSKHFRDVKDGLLLSNAEESSIKEHGTSTKKDKQSPYKSHCRTQQGAIFTGKILSFGCSVCKDNSTFSPNDLLKHFRADHKGTLPTYPCDLCDFVTNEFPVLQRHRIEHRNALVTCELCNDGFQYTLLLLTRHYIMYHSVNGLFSCDWCEFTTLDAGTFVQHIHHHNESHWKCLKCRHISLNEEDHKKHMKAHSGTFPFTCHVCGYGAARSEYLRKHTLTVHKDLTERSTTCKPLEDSSSQANSSASLKMLLKRSCESQEAQRISKLNCLSGSLPNQNGRLINPERSVEETNQFMDWTVTKKDNKNWSNSSHNREHPVPVMLQESDNAQSSDAGNHANANGLTVLMVKNKISLPPHCTTKVMGFKMVDGKKHLVLKVIPTAQRDSSTQSPCSVEGVGSPQSPVLNKSKDTTENCTGSDGKSLASNCLAVSPRSGSSIQKDQEDIMAVKVEEEETSVSSFRDAPCLMTSELNQEVDQSLPNETGCTNGNMVENESVSTASNSDIGSYQISNVSTLPTCKETLLSKTDLSKTAENCRAAVPSVCESNDKPTHKHKGNSAFNVADNHEEPSQISPEKPNSSEIKQKNGQQNANHLSPSSLPVPIVSTENEAGFEKCTQILANSEVFSFHNYSKEAFSISPNSKQKFDNCSEHSSDEESIHESVDFSLRLAESPEPQSECAGGDIEVDECLDSVETRSEENPDSVLQDFNIIKIEEENIPVSQESLTKTSSASLGKLVEKNSDALTTQQLNKEKTGPSSTSSDSSKQTKTTLRILQLPGSNQPVLFRTNENKFTLPVQVKATPGFKLITNSTNPQINVSYMKPGVKNITNTTNVSLVPNARVVAPTAKMGSTEKGTAILSAIHSGVGTNSNHILINSPGLKGPVFLSGTPYNTSTDKTAKTQPTCYLVQRSVPIVQAPSTPALRVATTQLPLNSQPVLAMPVSSADKTSTIQSGRQAFLLRYITPSKSGILMSNQEAKTGTHSSQTSEGTGNKVIFKIVTPTSSLRTSGVSTLNKQPLILATRPQTQCFLVSSNQTNVTASTEVKKLITIQSTAQKDVSRSCIVSSQLNVKVQQPSSAEKPILAPRSIRTPSQRKRHREALCEEFPESVHKSRRVTQKAPNEKEIAVLWKPVAKEEERTLRLSPFSSAQQIKCPRRYQPVVVLNHPDADIPEVLNIMKVVSKYNGDVTKVSLSQKTIQALSELDASEQNSSTKGPLLHSEGVQPRSVQSSVQERFLIKLKLRKKSRKKYEVVDTLSSCRRGPVAFRCWFCGRPFNNQEDWIGHGQRHLMEATRDWNKLF
ncbi:zinc finger protein 518A [Pholidichthys leucotaenia]